MLTNQSKGKGIAIFPGGFKPAHRDHLRVIDYLCGRKEIDEVLVVVSNRARLLPGSHLALGGQACAQALRDLIALCKPRKPVIVVLAKHKAIDHAFDYIQHAPTGATLWFCLGQEDAQRGDPRYCDLHSRSHGHPVILRTMIVPSGVTQVRASDVRALLARPEAGDAYTDLLPPQLSAHDKARHWQFLRGCLQPMASLVTAKVTRILRATPYADYEDAVAVDAGAKDPTFTLLTAQRATRTLLYAGDTVVAGSFFDASQPLPAHRLAVQVRALKAIAGQVRDRGWRISKVEYWDKRHRLLVLQEPTGLTPAFGGAEPANRALARRVLLAAATFLAELHSCKPLAEPLWGTEDDERTHWQTCLTNEAGAVGERIAAPQWTMLHLNCRPAHMRWDGETLGVTGFERASCFGDPALDLAILINGCRACGADGLLVETFLSAYQQARQQLTGTLTIDPNRCDRALEFASLPNG